MPRSTCCATILRLSQENLGADINIDVGQGTCTMKYSPKVNDQLVRSPKVAELHPLQDPDTVQGVREIIWRLEAALREISGMDRVSLQPGAGSAAIYTNVSMIRAYHASRGETQRDEVITTIFSHPSNAACARTAGYRITTLYPGPDGYPDLDALRAAVSERTAALLITNPEDTGIFNPRIEEFVRAVHDVGGLCSYDQANANGILGITRARDAGFDLCHFNLHKTFSTPHASGGPGAGACGVTEALVPFLPRPTVEFDGQRYLLDDDRPQSIGKIRPFVGVTPNLVRAYAWIMSLGAEGLREVAEIAVLNNNYLMQRISRSRERARRTRRATGASSRCATRGRGSPPTPGSARSRSVRAADFGVHYWTSHNVRRVRAVHARAHRVLLALGPRRVRGPSWPRGGRGQTEDPARVASAPHASTIPHHRPLRPGRPGALGAELARLPAQGGGRLAHAQPRPPEEPGPGRVGWVRGAPPRGCGGGASGDWAGRQSHRRHRRDVSGSREATRRDPPTRARAGRRAGGGRARAVGAPGAVPGCAETE